MDSILVIHYWAAGGSETLDDNSIEYRYKNGENWDVYAILLLLFLDIMIHDINV